MSTRTFVSLAECVADAQRHGFDGDCTMPGGFRLTNTRGDDHGSHA
jgi:hypothetical protein